MVATAGKFRVGVIGSMAGSDTKEGHLPYKDLTSPEAQAGIKLSRRKYYLANKERIKEKSWDRRKSVIALVNDLKSAPCTDCGNTFPAVCMDFDHVRGVKVANVCTMVHEGMSQGMVLREIEKCELVCANCHRIRTADRLG